jgi:hypothetical protein
MEFFKRWEYITLWTLDKQWLRDSGDSVNHEARSYQNYAVI